ncbi:MAG: tetratricopeptide repeat protein [Cyclobacteriaceae bacterium]
MKSLFVLVFAWLISLQSAALDTSDALNYYKLAYSLDEQGKHEEALSNYLKAYSLYGLDNPKTSAKILVNIGILFYNVQSYTRAIEFYELANKIHEPIQTYTFHNLGMAYSGQDKYEQALDYFEKNLELASSSSNQTQVSKTYLEMGIVSYEAEDYEGARFYAEEVKSRTEKDTLEIKLYAAALNNIANSYYAEKNYPLAKTKILECLSVFESRNIPYFKGHTLNNLGGTYKGLGLVDSSLYYFGLALKENQVANDIDETQISLSELADLYESLGEKDSALLYTRHLVDLFKSNSYRQIEFDKKAVGLRLETIQAKHLLEEEKGKSDDWVLPSILIGITSAVLILAPVGYLWRRSRRKSNL